MQYTCLSTIEVPSSSACTLHAYSNAQKGLRCTNSYKKGYWTKITTTLLFTPRVGTKLAFSVKQLPEYNITFISYLYNFTPSNDHIEIVHCFALFELQETGRANSCNTLFRKWVGWLFPSVKIPNDMVCRFNENGTSPLKHLLWWDENHSQSLHLKG